jgi:hypothetical protein
MQARRESISGSFGGLDLEGADSMVRALTGSLLLVTALLSVSDALACDPAAPTAPTATVLDGGRVQYGVVLPSGQAYVELFVRQNGIQNVALEVTSHAIDHGDGTSTYGVTLGGYHVGDKIEYRFYSYLPRSPGVFSPGPIEQAWLGATVAASQFVGSDRKYALGPQTNAKGESVDVEVYYASKTTRVNPVSVGWELLRADPSPFTTALLKGDASMLGVYVKTCEGGNWVAIGTTPFALSSPQEHTDPGGQYTYSGFFNGSLPGTRMTPDYECGGNDITIPTFIGPQTLRTNGEVTFAYVLEHR